jgi:hypothetical protein
MEAQGSLSPGRYLVEVRSKYEREVAAQRKRAEEIEEVYLTAQAKKNEIAIFESHIRHLEKDILLLQQKKLDLEKVHMSFVDVVWHYKKRFEAVLNKPKTKKNGL